MLGGQQRLTSLFASLEQASITHRVNGKKQTKDRMANIVLVRSSANADPDFWNKMPLPDLRDRIE